MPVNLNVLRDAELNGFFLREGYAVISVLTPSDVEALLDVYRRFSGGSNRIVNFTIDSSDPDYRLKMNDALKSVLVKIETVFNDYALFGPNFVTKPAGAGHLALHVDNAVVDEDESISVNAWTILHDVDEDFGCLTVIPQSHRWTRQGRGFGDQLELSAFRDVVDVLEKEFEKPIPLKAGQTILYHSRTMHGSMPNRRNEPRIATLMGCRQRQAPLLFHHRHSPTSVERFAASEEFYWTENFVHVRPAKTPSLGFVDFPIDPPLTAEGLRQLAADCARDVERGLP